ncbi:MAG: DNA-binding protein [Candidatus Korarchaeota archaeon]|nr:DNA-binding protein [Candidatus Korarchaeota archaeon]
MILDTSSVILRVSRGREVEGNITSITLIEYPPVRLYGKFRGKIYFLTEADQLRAASLQERMRSLGKPMSAADLLVAAVCLNRDEELLTTDEDFLSILEIEPALRVIVERPTNRSNEMGRSSEVDSSSLTDPEKDSLSSPIQVSRCGREDEPY